MQFPFSQANPDVCRCHFSIRSMSLDASQGESYTIFVINKDDGRKWLLLLAYKLSSLVTVLTARALMVLDL